MGFVAGVLIGALSVSCTSVRTKGTAKVEIHRCPLCSTTDNTHLEGKGVEWYIGGNPDLNVTLCNDTETSTANSFSWKLLDGAVVYGNHDSSYILRGLLNVVGSDVVIAGGTFENSIHVVGPNAKNVEIRDITVVEDDVAVRVYRGDPTGALLDVSGLQIYGVKAKQYAAAIAHTTDADMAVECIGAGSRDVILQPALPLTQASFPGCKEPVDLGKMLSVYGSTYEVEFYNFDYVDANPFLNGVARVLLIVDVVLLIIIGTCHGSKASALRKAKTE